MQSNAAATTDVTRTRAKARDKSAARLSVIEAARRLAEKNGIENLTLAAAAAEAGIARATVYGYFKNKDELLQAVVADDVTDLNALVAGEPVAHAGSAEAEPVDAPQAEEAPTVEPPAAVVKRTEAPAAAPGVVVTPTFRGEQKAQLNTILSKLTPNDPADSEGSAAAMARFDRRLRVVERTLGGVQAHQQQADKTTSVSTDSLSETLRGLNQRLEESERRQREAFADLRASAREASRRLEVLEKTYSTTPIQAEAPMVMPVEAPAPEPTDDGVVEPLVEETMLEEGEAAEQVVAEAQEGAKQVEDQAPREVKPATWLDAARQSANASVQQPEKPVRPKSWLYRVPRKYLMFTCAALSVVVFFIGVLVVQRATAIAAMAEPAPQHLAKQVVRRAPQRIASATPLDELSALASSGNGKAQLLVGLKYLKGDSGVPKNPVAATQWIARAAQRGEPMAQYWAGYVYQHGIGVSADPDEAMRWYEAAADQGNVKAMYNLGVGNAQGWTGAKDVPEAARWFARAARLGYVDAQFNLAVLYERGEGVPPSMMDAYKWYAIAAANGDLESKQRLDAMTTQMGADDVAAAQRSAEVFHPTPVVGEANQMPTLDLKRG